MQNRSDTGQGRCFCFNAYYGQELVGRIEAAADRKAEALIVKNIWYEPGIKVTKALERAMDSGIRRLAKFNECDQVVRTI